MLDNLVSWRQQKAIGRSQFVLDSKVLHVHHLVNVRKLVLKRTERYSRNGRRVGQRRVGQAQIEQFLAGLYLLGL